MRCLTGSYYDSVERMRFVMIIKLPIRLCGVPCWGIGAWRGEHASFLAVDCFFSALVRAWRSRCSAGPRLRSTYDAVLCSNQGRPGTSISSGIRLPLGQAFPATAGLLNGPLQFLDLSLHSSAQRSISLLTPMWQAHVEECAAKQTSHFSRQLLCPIHHDPRSMPFIQQQLTHMNTCRRTHSHIQNWGNRRQGILDSDGYNDCGQIR